MHKKYEDYAPLHGGHGGHGHGGHGHGTERINVDPEYSLWTRDMNGFWKQKVFIIPIDWWGGLNWYFM